MSIILKLGYEDSSWAAQRFDRKTAQVEPSLWDMLLGVEIARNPFNQLQTTREAKQLFENLKRQEAIVRLGNTPQLIKTPTLPKPRVSESAISRIEDMYADLLLTPVAKQTTTPSNGAQQEDVIQDKEVGESGPTEKKIIDFPPSPRKKRARRRIE